MKLTFFSSILTMLLILLSTNLFGQEKYSKTKIYIPLEKISEMNVAGLNLDHYKYNIKDSSITTSLNETDIEKLKKLSFKFEILVENEVADFLKNNTGQNFYQYANKNKKSANNSANARLAFETPCSLNFELYKAPKNFTEGSMGGYYTLKELMIKIDELKKTYPSLVDTFSLPTLTWKGRRIKVIKISDNAAKDEDETELLYSSLIHAREPTSMMTLVFFMQYILENYTKNPKIAELINGRELFFIPCLNPDGYVENERTNPKGGGMQRKNMRSTADTGNIGVDLNRNFAVNFALDNVGSSSDINDDTYRGPSAFSEPETKAYSNFINSRKFNLIISHHAFGKLLITPEDRGKFKLTEEEKIFYKNMAPLLTKYNSYWYGNLEEIIEYSANGDESEWVVHGGSGCAQCGPKRNTIHSLGAEVGEDFWPTKENIIPIAREMFFTQYQAACMAGSYYDVQDTSSLGINSLKSDAGCVVRNWGLQQKDVTVSLIPLQNIASVGASITIAGNSFASFNSNKYRRIPYTLKPGLASGSIVKYAWRVSSDGLTVDDTITKVFNPKVLFFDNMELGAIKDPASKWVSDKGWDFTTKSFFNGKRSLSQPPINESDSTIAGGATSVTIKKSIDLSGSTTALLSYFTRYRAKSGNLYPLISTNGVGKNANWAPLCGRLTIPIGGEEGIEPGMNGVSNEWIREIIDLSPYKNQKNVGISFDCLPPFIQTKGEEGFYLDDVSIITNASGKGVNLAARITNNIFSITPNPSQNGNFTIRLQNTDALYVSIWDVCGRELKTIAVNGQSTISVESLLPPGFYFIKVTDKYYNTTSEKLVVQ